MARLAKSLVSVALLPFHCEAELVQLAVFDGLSFLYLVLRISFMRRLWSKMRDSSVPFLPESFRKPLAMVLLAVAPRPRDQGPTDIRHYEVGIRKGKTHHLS